MSLVLATSPSAKKAWQLVQELQELLVRKLDELTPDPQNSRFRPMEWLRAEGKFGGGHRFVATDESLFNRASVNVSQVQYDADPTKKLASATALSTIIHPKSPLAPSMHMHISWTEMKSGEGYWRIMADLNPSNPVAGDTLIFEAAMAKATGELYPSGREQGERYFYIPSLDRHRGVAHFYLEEHRSGDPDQDFELARRFGITMADAYARILKGALSRIQPSTEVENWHQLEYHSIYFLQVLTLDRGTTSGLLVHDENDTGILGSLPSHVDRNLLQVWRQRLPALQNDLLGRILAVLTPDHPTPVTDRTKSAIAKVTRSFYKEHPEALELLARGDRVPPTQENHR